MNRSPLPSTRCVAFHQIEGLNVLVIGGGPIGNLVGQASKAFGAANVVVSELSETQLEGGGTVRPGTINSKDEDLSEGILRHFGDRKADTIFECVGSSFTVAQSIEVAQKGAPSSSSVSSGSN